jgi:hypothetical protein
MGKDLRILICQRRRSKVLVEETQNDVQTFPVRAGGSTAARNDSDAAASSAKRRSRRNSSSISGDKAPKILAGDRPLKSKRERQSQRGANATHHPLELADTRNVGLGEVAVVALMELEGGGGTAELLLETEPFLDPGSRGIVA